jgi:large subunit ribosomal protein L29
MKLRELNELKAMSAEELDTSLKEKKNELFNLRFQLATGQLQNTSEICAVRRDIARVKTILRQREEERKGGSLNA